MAKDRFLFVTWSGGGNTAPTYPLARSLVTRGHKVTMLGQSAQAEAVRELGARFLPLGVSDWTAGKSLEEEPEFFSVLLGPAVGRLQQSESSKRSFRLPERRGPVVTPASDSCSVG